MTEEKERELEKRVDDIHAIREMLTQSNEIPLIFPWAFFAWAVLVALGTILHYILRSRIGINVKAALVWIWLPIIIIGAVAEGISFVQKARKSAVPIFNRRIGGAMLGGLASAIILTIVGVRLALLLALTPGLAILFCSLAVVFYAQLSCSTLFIEAFSGIAIGLLFEFADQQGVTAFLVGGGFVTVLYAVCGLHVALIERRRRG